MYLLKAMVKASCMISNVINMKVSCLELNCVEELPDVFLYGVSQLRRLR